MFAAFCLHGKNMSYIHIITYNDPEYMDTDTLLIQLLTNTACVTTRDLTVSFLLNWFDLYRSARLSVQRY